jgi:hypothetical protein
MGAGFLVNTNSSSRWIIKFLGWISPLKYATQLLLVRVLDGKDQVISDGVLSYFGYTYPDK